MSGFVVGLITMVHIVVCIALMAAILLQSGKGGGLAGAFGAGSSQTLFGGRGAATFLSRATTFLAVTFFLTSLTLGLQASRSGGGAGGRSLIQEEARKRGQQREATVPAGGTQQAPAPAGGTQQAPGPVAGQPPVSGVNQPPVTGVPLPAPSQTPPAQAPAPSTGSATQAPAGGGTRAPATGGK